MRSHYGQVHTLTVNLDIGPLCPQITTLIVFPFPFHYCRSKNKNVHTLGPTLRSFNTCIHHQCLHIHLKIHLSFDGKSIVFLEMEMTRLQTKQRRNCSPHFGIRVVEVHKIIKVTIKQVFL